MSSRVAVPFPGAGCEGSGCSACSPASGRVSAPGSGHSNCSAGVSHCRFIYVPLMTYDVKHLICIFVICISSLVKCLFKFLVHVLIRLLVFLLISFKSTLYILDNSPLPEVSFAILFFQPMPCFQILLILTFAEQTFLILKPVYQLCLSWILSLVLLFPPSF